ncbi:hypothetical protein [Thalassomonas sp. RHCl1]|uniref:hypothetical protein n=1 Tax=Thalassomonas sp. RHCl1 TaxID=2995320 RepID=UPI00248BEB96|nr:hypothetical protein [Thalassomonas sp. RHCl1]
MPVNLANTYRKMYSSKFFICLSSVVILAVLALIDLAVVNTIVSGVILILAGGCYWLCYSLWRNRKESSRQAAMKLSSRLAMALLLAPLCALFVFFSYYLLRYEAFEVMCRFGSCAFGPYGWVVALLSSGCALLFIIVCYLLVFPFKYSSKNQ